MQRLHLSYSSLVDLILLTPILTFAIWVYLAPPFHTFGFHPLFSDDAIFAILARKVLNEGFSGAFHLSWGPLLPWLNAFLYQMFNLPLEEGPRVITGISLTLRVIPIYFLAKYLFGRMAALISIILVTLYTFLLIPQEAALAEGLYSLVIFTGFLFSYLALKTEKIRWYLLSGGIWGVAYLVRLEGWFFLTPLFLLTGLKLLQNSPKRLLSVKLLFVSLVTFLIISSPFLSFIKQVYGSLTLNPRMNIVLVAPGNMFTFHKDINWTTTVAQIYFSGDPKYYTSSLWHPEPFLFWRALGRSWSTLSIIPITYFHYFQERAGVLLIGGTLGLLLILFTVFKQNLRLILMIISFSVISFSMVDFSLTTLEFTSPIIFNPEGNLTLFFDQFWKMLNTPGYPQPLVRDFILFLVATTWLITNKTHLGHLVRHTYTNRLNLYLPLALFLGFLPLFFNSFANKYAIATGAIFSIFTGFLITSLCSLFTNILRRFKSFIPQAIVRGIIYIIVLSSFLWINRLQIYQTVDIRESQYKPQPFQENFLRKPGLAILKDHGPGAKIATFHEAPVFYAHGETFYFAADSNITLEKTLSYFEANQVDYFVANKFQAFYAWKQLRPLLLPTTKLSNWKMIYSDPSEKARIKVTDTDTDMLVTVWKRVN